MEKEELPKLKKLLAATHLKLTEMSNDELYGWYLVLEPYPYEQCRDAILEWARTSRYSPHPGEIARLIEAKSPSVTDKPKPYTPAATADEHYRYMAGVYAKIAGIEPPSPAEDPLEWFKEARCREKQ